MSLVQGLRDALSARRPAGLTTIELTCGLDLESLLQRLAPRPGACPTDPGFECAALWDTRGSETLDAELTLGLGSALEVVAPRLADVRPQLAGLFRRVASSPATERLRAFGGAAFDERQLGPFGALGSARLIVPRWTLSALPGNQTRALLVLDPADDLALERATREAAVLDATSPEVEPSLQPPHLTGRVLDDGVRAFVQLAERASRSVTANELEKVVVARRARVETALSPGAVLGKLAGSAGCVRFALATREAAFLGATPELLVALDERGVRTEAVAGSEPRRGKDRMEVARLLMRDKDQREHALVVNSIRADLETAGAIVGPRHSARVRSLSHVHHLVTPISAHAAATHVLDLALALHPTPAMGGVPKAAAASFLNVHESIERGWYAAPFGWCDARGHGAFVVGIRSALMLPAEAWVFSGAGIVRGSVTEIELAETHAKQQAMLSALGVAGLAERRRSPAGAERKEAGA